MFVMALSVHRNTAVTSLYIQHFQLEVLPLSGFEPTNRPAGNLVIMLTELAQLASNTFLIKITNYALTSKVMCLKKIYSVVAMSSQT
jgi:hypothetical protein